MNHSRKVGIIVLAIFTIVLVSCLSVSYTLQNMFASLVETFMFYE